MPTLPNTWQVPRIAPVVDIFQHEQEQVVVLILAVAFEPFLRLGELQLERSLVGRQVGEAAAGQFAQLVQGAKIVGRRGADPEAHRGPSAASRNIVSADSAARSPKDSTIRNSSME